MNRRDLLAGLIVATLPVTALRAQDANLATRAPLLADWEAWKQAYLTPDGRVVDALQNGSSHSESQGYGLFLAATFGDQEAFNRIYGWSEMNLAIRSDALLAWRWKPDATDAVADTNNASDGDLFYAWGLITMAAQGGDPALLARATAIATDLAAKCIISHPDGTGRVLLAPAAEGFERDGAAIINFSYYMPLAMRELASATGVDILATCANDGAAIMAELAASGLMPDWIAMGPDGPTVAAGMSDHNGYEALRIALFLAWSGDAKHPAVIQQVKAYRASATSDGTTPTVFDRLSGAVLSSSPDAGYAAIAALVDCAVETTTGAALPAFSPQQPYYPGTLHLMTLIAQITAYQRCFPL